MLSNKEFTKKNTNSYFRACSVLTSESDPGGVVYDGHFLAGVVGGGPFEHHPGRQAVRPDLTIVHLLVVKRPLSACGFL